MQKLRSSPGCGGPRKTVEPGLTLKERKRLECHGGKYPSVSLNNSATAVIVHNSTMGNSMWYWVGRLDEVAEEIFWAKGHHFDYGISPSVALKDSGHVVEVHRSQWRHELNYTLGKVSGDFIKWGKCRTYANGVDASVAVNNSDTVVAVHVSNDTCIHCKVGEISSKTMKWSSPDVLGTGKVPHVAINDSNTVVVVYQSANSQCCLHCQVGVVNKRLLYWGQSIEYAYSLNASVSLNIHNRMVILRQGIWLDELVYGVAKVNQQAREVLEEDSVEQCRNHKLTEHRIHNHRDGISSNTYWHPSISMNDQGKILIVYASSSGHG